MEEAAARSDVTAYRRKVGDRLRAIRRQKGLSLQDVEARSDHEFRASVLGAYERGERAISVPRLQRLAAFYSVPVDQLLPGGGDERESISRRATAGGAVSEPVTIDLTSLHETGSEEARKLERFVEMIQVQRQDFNGRVLTIRRDDLRAVACILDTTVEGVRGRLEDVGLLLVR